MSFIPVLALCTMVNLGNPAPINDECQFVDFSSEPTFEECAARANRLYDRPDLRAELEQQLETRLQINDPQYAIFNWCLTPLQLEDMYRIYGVEHDLDPSL